LLPASGHWSQIKQSPPEILICFFHLLNTEFQHDNTYPVLHENEMAEPNNMSVVILMIPFFISPGLGHDFSKRELKFFLLNY
jgi:hypothetical protein